MACDLTQGYTWGTGCTTYAGGLKAIAFLESFNGGVITSSYVTGLVTGWVPVATKTFKVYRVMRNKSFVTDIPTVTENGGKSYAPTISMFLNDLTTQLRLEIDRLLSLTTYVAFLGNDNVWRLAGRELFMRAGLSGSDANFGTAMGDGHQQTIVFSGEEEHPMLEINTATATALGLPLL